MKKIVIIMIIGLLVSNKNNAQVDSMKMLRDSIYNFKSNYIGKPLFKLIYDLKVPVGFGLPDNAGSRAKGLAYYKNIILFLPFKKDYGSCGFKIQLATYTTINIAEMRATTKEQWNKEMTLLLGSVNIVSIDKIY